MPAYLLMPLHLPAKPNRNQPIVAAGQSVTDLCYFNLLRLKAGETATIVQPGYELLFVVLAGQADICVGKQLFSSVGQRADIWSGQADSVYAGTGAETTVTGRAPETEIAIAGGRCAQGWAPFRVNPNEVEMVEVGSLETHSRRRIFHVLGQNGNGRAGNLW